MPEHVSKICLVCGRTMHWRKKWERSWDEVRYCSSACRRRGRRPIDAQLESTIMELLASRSGDSGICPSEAARAVGGDMWEELVEAACAAARRMDADGRVVITQGGRPVDPSTAKGPIRVRLS